MHKNRSVIKHLSVSAFLTLVCTAPAIASQSSASDRQAFYGDLHLHTKLSMDAYVMMGTRVDPDTTYRFAKGETIDYLGESVRRDKPLDFLAITDHAENLGFFIQLEDPESELSQSAFGKMIAKHIADNNGMEALKDVGKYQFEGKPIPGPDALVVGKSNWRYLIDTANKFYAPGKFTTFIGYEWTAMIDGANLHRNIIFKGNDAPAPFTSADSRNPEDLWRYLETIRTQDYEALAIPHNGNASNGLMYDWTAQDGKPIDKEYARLQAANEPLSEIAQNKGTSETHPLLSPNDEFAEFEIFDRMLTLPPRKGKVEGSYLREALGRGLVIGGRVGVNPYKFGFVGSSDLHSGLSASAEKDYGGSPSLMNFGGGKPDGEQAKIVVTPNTDTANASLDVHTGMSPRVASSGTLTGVWAEANNRESIYDALRRKEVFATSGTRLKLRFFGGWNFDSKMTDRDDWVQMAYNTGAPMGSDLPTNPRQAETLTIAPNLAPTFAIWAMKDPDGGNLDRAQVVKVWLKDGEHREKIYDVAWSDGRIVNLSTGKLSAVGSTVDLSTGTYSNTIGNAQLHTVWSDPDFDKDQAAAYYLRVLEIPTPRWSTLLAIENKLPVPTDVAATIQERGWSSPIWYAPASN